MFSRIAFYTSLTLASFALLGCDPGMPGASGNVTLGDGVDPANFQNIEMRALAAEGEFFPIAPVFPDQISDNTYQTGEGEATVWIGEGSTQDTGIIFLQRGESLQSKTFPFAYQIGGDGIGYSTEQHWRLFVWLSTNPDSHLDKAPQSGEPYGVVDFDLPECGSDYCQVQTGVDLVIDQTAP